MTVFTVTSGVRIVTDNIYLLPPDATAHRVIRACHTCKHHRRSESDHRSCDATGEDLEFSREDDYCGEEYRWWEPAPPALPEPPKLSVLARLRRWLVG
jgi:hypothetical protein